MSINAHTKLVSLLGYPVEHSLSPLIHNTAFEAQGLNCAYVAFSVAPEAIEQAVAGLVALGFLGSNVTVPHKQAVLPLMDELSPQARAVGAVNTIVCRRTQEEVTLFGDNTDVAGFLEPLQPVQGKLEGAEVVVLGAGGAARAVVYALLSTFRPKRLTIAARTRTRAEGLAHDLSGYDENQALHVMSLDEARSAVRNSTLLVNATPVGMHPHSDGTPWPDAGDFSREQIVYDLIYKPEATRLLQDASARGAQTIGGLDMLILQAAASYIQWTNQPMPLDVVRKALQQAGIGRQA